MNYGPENSGTFGNQGPIQASVTQFRNQDLCLSAQLPRRLETRVELNAAIEFRSTDRALLKRDLAGADISRLCAGTKETWTLPG